MDYPRYCSRAGRRDASGSCAGRALVARARQVGKLACWRVLRQRRQHVRALAPRCPRYEPRRPAGRPVNSNLSTCCVSALVYDFGVYEVLSGDLASRLLDRDCANDHMLSVIAQPWVNGTAEVNL